MEPATEPRPNPSFCGAGAAPDLAEVSPARARAILGKKSQGRTFYDYLLIDRDPISGELVATNKYVVVPSWRIRSFLDKFAVPDKGPLVYQFTGKGIEPCSLPDSTSLPGIMVRALAGPEPLIRILPFRLHGYPATIHRIGPDDDLLILTVSDGRQIGFPTPYLELIAGADWDERIFNEEIYFLTRARPGAVLVIWKATDDLLGLAMPVRLT